MKFFPLLSFQPAELCKLLFLIIPLFFSSSEASGKESQLFDSANVLYTENNFEAAAAIYEEIIGAGTHSAEIYYNLGNAYYRLNRLSSALINYERALKLAPRDEDILFNLNIAKSHLIDKIEEIPEFFLIRWIKYLSGFMSTDRWAYAGVACFLLGLFSALGFLFARAIPMRKALFTLLLVFMIFSISAMYMSWTQKNMMTDKSHAIITLPVVVVKSSPDENSADLFVLHEGTRIQIASVLGEWSEIRIADGKKGWARSGSFEQI